MARISKPNGDPVTKKPLTGGVALVTGASRGVGPAIAHQLALLGSSVSICARDPAALEDSAQAMAKTGAHVHFQIADVTKAPDIADLVAKTEQGWAPSPSSSTMRALACSAQPTKKPRTIGIGC